ncbi:MAG: lipid-binding SYLF domain-containing protein [Desulfomonilia bacterium]
MKRLSVSMILLLAVFSPSLSSAAVDTTGNTTLKESINTFSAIMTSPDTSIPSILLKTASGIIIIPDMFKASFLMGVRYGKGVLMVKYKDGRWSNPVIITIAGGSFGLQMGIQSTDLILVFTRSQALDMRSKGNVLLGADVSIVAGSLNFKLDENDEASQKGEVYSFSKAVGLNAGFALQGAYIRMDDEATATVYGKSRLTAYDVLWGRAVTVPSEVFRFKENFSRLTDKTSY